MSGAGTAPRTHLFAQEKGDVSAPGKALDHSMVSQTDGMSPRSGRQRFDFRFWYGRRESAGALSQGVGNQRAYSPICGCPNHVIAVDRKVCDHMVKIE